MEILSSPGLLAAVFCIVVVAAIVQAGLGMGFGQTAAPLLALIDPHLVPASVLFLGMATSAWGAMRERDAIHWNEVGLGMMGRLAGVIAGSAILASLSDRRLFMLIFGLLIASAVLLSVSGWRMAFNRVTLLLMSSFSGLMGTITSVGAPPMALIYQDRPARDARPTLAAFFAIGCALSLAGLYLSGWAGLRDFELALLMVPPMLIGTFIARGLGARFDRRFRPALLIVASLAAAMLIYRGLA
jgi:uncharacterized protein